MRCVICRNGETSEGVTTLALERDGATVVIRHVPALVCENCGEEYVDEAAARRALDDAGRAVDGGATVEIRDFVGVPA